jgi:hypothetical protein
LSAPSGTHPTPQIKCKYFYAYPLHGFVATAFALPTFSLGFLGEVVGFFNEPPSARWQDLLRFAGEPSNFGFCFLHDRFD